MATAVKARPEPVSLEEYLTTVYQPDAEFVDGVIEERAIGEDDHSAWQVAVITLLNVRSAEWNIRVRSELRTRTGDGFYRVPDIAILDANLPREPIATQPPLAIFEILSPEDRHKRLLVRLADFERMGVASIYVIDPEDGTLFRFHQGVLGPESRIKTPRGGSISRLPRLQLSYAEPPFALHNAASRSYEQGCKPARRMKVCLPLPAPRMI